MDLTDRLRSWTPRLLLILVFVLLGLSGVIQYQWFSRSAAVEIEGTFRGLEAGVRQAVVREFQRYAPVITELEALRDRTPAPEEARAVLDRVGAAYGPGGTVSGLLSWVGYRVPGQNTYLRRTPTGAWTTLPLPVEAEWAAVSDNLGSGFRASRENVLVYRPAPGAPVLLVGLDIPAFFDTYVFAALRELHPGADLTWGETNREPPPPGTAFDVRTYAFNPFTALVAGPSLSPVLEVGVPKFIDLPGRPGPGSGNGGGPRVFAAWTVTVRLPADAPVLGVERRLAWNWLGGVLVLLVLGTAFGFLQGQAARLAALRRREREFVASVSHELRTPLTVIRSAADNFRQGIVAADRQVRYGELIHDQSLRLGRMVEQMLSFAQAEAGTAPRVEALLEFAPWAAEIRPPLDTLAATRAVHLVWDLAGVPAAGRTDPEGLRLILENLVVNAINHAYPPPETPGPRAIRITLRHLVPDRLELTVDDDGRGIAPAEARKVFEPFYRDQVSRDKQEKGSGLGLFLAQRQARRLGGELRLESPWRRLDGTKRPGCRFVALLPFTPQLPTPTEEVPHGR